MRRYGFVITTTLACSRPHVEDAPRRAMGSRLPEHVAGAASIPVHAVTCLHREGAPLCAVVVGPAENAPSEPRSAAAQETVHGDAISVTRWFSHPEPTSKRPFTLITANGSRTVWSDRKTRYYDHMSHVFAREPRVVAQQGTASYVVDAKAEWAIEGEHASMRFFPLTPYLDVAEPEARVPREDSAWQKAAPADRRIVSAEFRDEFTGGYRVDGAVVARIERGANKDRWVSFSYIVGDQRRAEWPCTESGPPIGILVVAGTAKWVFRAPPPK